MALSTIQNNSFADTAVHGYRNLIINGAMQVAQRGTSSTTAVTAGVFHTVDRIKTGGSSSIGQWTASQDTDAPAGFTNSYKLACTTADTSLAAGDHYGITYHPEGYHMDAVAKGTSDAKPLTLSFYLKATVTKTLVVELTDAGNARHVNFAVTPSATNTWERIVLNIPADTSGSFNQGGISKAGEINFWLSAGSTFTSGSVQSTWTTRSNANIMAGVSNWADSTSNAIWITGLQLELGSEATPFEHRSYGQELALCQRYYQYILKTCRLDVYRHTGTSPAVTLNYATEMRSTPSFTLTRHSTAYGSVNTAAGTDGLEATNSTNVSTGLYVYTIPYPTQVGVICSVIAESEL